MLLGQAARVTLARICRMIGTTSTSPSAAAMPAALLRTISPIPSAGYIALLGLLALGIGLIVRSSAAGIAAALGLVLVVPIILQILASVTRAAWPSNIAAFLPSGAGSKLYAYPGAEAESLTPGRAGGAGSAAASASAADVITLDSWQALLVLIGWVVVALVIGGILVKRRDA